MPKSQAAKELAAKQKAQAKAEKERRKHSDNPKDWSPKTTRGLHAGRAWPMLVPIDMVSGRQFLQVHTLEPVRPRVRR